MLDIYIRQKIPSSMALPIDDIRYEITDSLFVQPVIESEVCADT